MKTEQGQHLVKTGVGYDGSGIQPSKTDFHAEAEKLQYS